MSGYRLELGFSAVGGETADERLISRMVAVDNGDAMREELGSALMIRSGCVVSGESGRGSRDCIASDDKG